MQTCQFLHRVGLKRFAFKPLDVSILPSLRMRKRAIVNLAESVSLCCGVSLVCELASRSRWLLFPCPQGRSSELFLRIVGSKYIAYTSLSIDGHRSTACLAHVDLAVCFKPARSSRKVD